MRRQVRGRGVREAAGPGPHGQRAGEPWQVRQAQGALPVWEPARGPHPGANRSEPKLTLRN